MVTEKTIAEMANLWKEEKRQFVKKSTYATYSLIVETHILPAFGDLTTVTEKYVQEFVLQKLQSGLSQKTIKDMLIVLCMILKFGAKKQYCAYVPFDVIFPTDREKQELDVLSVVNQRKIVSYVRDNFTFRNLGILICLSTGIRIGEVCALTWDDIDIDNGVIHIRPTYGERSAEYMAQFPWEKNQTVNPENEIRWNVFYHNCNSRSIETFNVFEHGSFREYVKKAAKKYQSKEDFAKQLRSEVMYYFWSKCEWEVLVTPWISPRESEKKKVDVCWQIMNNWDVFVDYTWANRKKL